MLVFDNIWQSLKQLNWDWKKWQTEALIKVQSQISEQLQNFPHQSRAFEPLRDPMIKPHMQ